MADATTTAKDRIDRALATLERKVLELKARPATAALESAGRDAAGALALAADAVRDILDQQSRDGQG